MVALGIPEKKTDRRENRGFPAFFQKGGDKMTLQEAIDITDEMKPNTMSRKLKIKGINEIEGIIHSELVMTHEHAEEEETRPVYTEDTDPGTALIAQEPYDMVYVYWLMKNIDMQNQEDERYNIDALHYNEAWNELANMWTRTKMPIQKTREFRI